MIVLHAALLGRDVFLWGEKSLAEAGGLAKRRTRKGSAPSANALPSDAEAETLAAALAEILSGWSADNESLATLTAWLPTAEGKPAASTPLIAASSEVGKPVALAAWRVSALKLDHGTLVDLLCLSLEERTLRPGLLVGRDLAFWAQALRLASALVARQQFLPGVVKSNGNWRACWEAVFTGTEANRLTKLVEIMPHVCRALTPDASAPPAAPATAVLTEFINGMVDHLVRLGNGSAATLRRLLPRAGRTRLPSTVCTTNGCTRCARRTG